jgi:hypothetical protein
VKAGDLEVRQAREDDLPQLRTFRCSTGEPWENLVEEQIRQPLAARYMSSPAAFDGRLLLGFDRAGHLLVVGAHRIEPTFVPDVGYVEVVAVALDARGTLVEMPRGEELSLGHFMLATIFRQMVRLGRHRRTFARVDHRNTRSLSLLHRAGLTHELPDPHDSQLVQRWGELGQAIAIERSPTP